ncbi:MAG: Gfo/Idh/MocA family oxidoreductase [Burkholderiaceae bacterium]
MSAQPIGIGVVGLGRAFVLTQSALEQDPRVRLVAACAPRAQSRRAFEARYPGSRTTDSVADLCALPGVDLVYVATPHQLHAEHVLAIANSGRHLLVEKPLAIDLDDALRMQAAVEAAGVQLVVGPSHGFDAPVQLAMRLIAQGTIGPVRMIQAINYTDFLYRPRRPEELDTAQGGGVVFSQGAHQVDIVRLLAGGAATSVYAHTGRWDPDRPTEGAYSAMLQFAHGVSATLTYSGYAHFDTDEWMDWIGELGQPKSPGGYGQARRVLAGVGDAAAEAALKATRTFGGQVTPAPATAHEHFGPVLVLGGCGDLRLTPHGVWVYGDHERRFEPAPLTGPPRGTLIDAVVAAVRGDVAPRQSAAWGVATLEICQAILASARLGEPVRLRYQ